MKKNIWIVLIIVASMTGCKKNQSEKERMCSRMDMDKILSFFPRTVDDVGSLGSDTQQMMNDMVQKLDTIATKDKTFANTVRPYDVAKFHFLMNKNLLTILAVLSSDQAIQSAAKAQSLSLDRYEVDVLNNNVSIYQAFDQYYHGGSGPEMYHKRGANQQFLQKMLQKFEHSGMQLPVEQRADFVLSQKDANHLAARFNGNIVYDSRTIVATASDLAGISESFIKTLNRDGDNYLLPIDFDTFSMVMENCESEYLRKEYFLAFGQQGYPQNKHVLQELLDKRNELARTVGFDDFASYELSDQMVENPKHAEKFLWQIIDSLQKYDKHDFEVLTKHLPASVKLTKQNKLNPWDEAFVKSWYCKQHFSVNDHDLAAYFPLDHTLDKLLELFAKFFYLEFKKEEIASEQVWAPDVICYRVYSLKTQSILGYLFLDLYKHSYKKVQSPCRFMLIPTIKDDCTIPCAGASVMVANFTVPTESVPTLLELSDVISLFHELGHALHALFGSACFVDYSGTQCVQDFVEVPSQMLEHWLKDASVLGAISKHYQTAQPLPAGIIEQILAAQRFGKVSTMLKQAFLGLVSLNLHRDMQGKDIHAAVEKLYKKVFKHVAYEPEYYFEYSFADLANYGASYYAHIWSRVIAADLFEYIKQHGGISDSVIGREYAKDILSPGGFISPQHMIKKFLKRPFNNHAFAQQFEQKG